MKYMGIDYGDVRTGIAVTDSLGMLASGVGTVKANGKRALISEIKKKAEELGVEMFIVGNPINMNGTVGERSEKVKAFAAELSDETGIPYEMYDERCSTMVAHSIMNITDTRGKKRKENVDTLSAQIILQDYIDRKRATEKINSPAAEENGTK